MVYQSDVPYEDLLKIEYQFFSSPKTLAVFTNENMQKHCYKKFPWSCIKYRLIPYNLRIDLVSFIEAASGGFALKTVLKDFAIFTGK